jgi:hypothetical protein
MSNENRSCFSRAVSTVICSKKTLVVLPLAGQIFLEAVPFVFIVISGKLA